MNNSANKMELKRLQQSSGSGQTISRLMLLVVMAIKDPLHVIRIRKTLEIVYIMVHELRKPYKMHIISHHHNKDAILRYLS